MRFNYSTNVANSDPGSGNFKFDALLASGPIIIRISKTQAGGGGDATAEFLRWGNTSQATRGFIVITNRTQFGIAIVGLYGAMAINANYVESNILVQVVSLSGAFADTDSCDMFFIPNQGSDNYLWGSNSGNSIANTTSETDFSEQFTLPGDVVRNSGHGNTLSASCLKFRYAGVYSTTGTPTLAFQLKGTNAGGTQVILNTGALPTASGASNKGFVVDIEVNVPNGNAGTCRVIATITFNGLAPIVISSGDVAFDATLPTLFKLTGQWSVASASNSITLRSSRVLLEAGAFFPAL